ncbi:flagellar hook assembly protein FlgD [Yersinia sp. HM-2024]|uniref:flagellar hook assembly protein FlgD n=1 Tax=Yersinia sp. HM-2024 TaxID=3344550 RepID=UPI00370D5D5E
MAVSPVTTSSDNAANSRSLGNTSDELLNSFMTLLVAQMQNQDPTNPMDNNQLTSQLAQFQTAAGIEQLNTTVLGVGALVNSMQQMNAADWVGRTVLIEGKPVVSTSEDGNQDFSFSLGSDAEKVTVTLTDDEGNTYVGTLKDVKAGVHTYSLDDVTDFQPTDPREQADTTFTVSYSAITESGDSPKIVELKRAQVESVSFSQSGAVLHLGIDGTAMLGQIFLVQ